MKRVVSYILVICLFWAMVQAADDAGTDSPFSMGIGARELSLGGSNQAGCNASTAPYWNPSRLAIAERISLSVFHSYLFDTDAAYQYFGLAFPTMDFGSFGLGVFRLGISDIERRDENNFYLYSFNDNRLAIYLAYARVVSGYNLGFSLNMEHHSIDDYSTTSSPGVNLAVSRQYNIDKGIFKDISISLVGRNVITPKMKLVNENVSYTIGADLSGILSFKFVEKWDHLTRLSIGVNKVDYVTVGLRIGLEYNIGKLLRISGGIRKRNLSFGTGLSYKGFEFDYALVERDMGYLHMFTMTSSFGASLNNKRMARFKKREIEFNGMMNSRLTEQNKDMIKQLIDKGQKMQEEGDLVEATNSFDRALFLARSSGLDTIRISELANEASRRLEDISKKQRYAEYIQTAQSKLSMKDYWGAKHFANLALTEMPNSVEAKKVIGQVDNSIKEITSLEETIQNQLWISDSLFNYGLIDQALYIVEDLVKIAPNNNGVKLALKKIRFEKLKLTASTAFNNRDYRESRKALDSALLIFPDHNWCLNLKNRIAKKLGEKQKVIKQTVPASRESLSPEIRKEANAAYEQAQVLFKNGDLQKAIVQWEKVERIAPDFMSVRSYLVNAYKYVGVDLYGKNLLNEALSIWQKAADLDPENSEIQNFIKRTEAEIQKLKELSDVEE
jgi:tetratricopeptide (TPR) repeat protein